MSGIDSLELACLIGHLGGDLTELAFVDAGELAETKISLAELVQLLDDAIGGHLGNTEEFGTELLPIETAGLVTTGFLNLIDGERRFAYLRLLQAISL